MGSPVASLNRFESGRDAFLRPALMLRRCETEQRTREANSAAATSFGINGSRGCVSAMVAYYFHGKHSKVNQIISDGNK